MAGTDRAVVVGITRYPDLGDLQGPENDAQAFRDWLVDPTGGAVPADNVRLILSSAYPASTSVLDAEPSNAAVENAFDELYQLGDENQGKAGRRLYIFMAGHGFAPTLTSSALLMANATHGRAGYNTAGRLYADWFRQARFFDEVVLFMDCCRENYPRAPLRPVPYETRTANHLARYYYGFATEWSDAARERPWNGLVRGVFSRSVLSGLRAASTPGGAITGASLEAFVFNSIGEGAPEGEDRQEPKFDYDKMNDITFARGIAQYRLHATLGPPFAGQTPTLLGGSPLSVIAGTQVPEGWVWDLQARGIYKMILSGGTEHYVEVTGEQEQVDVAF
jgi:Caspase domain